MTIIVDAFGGDNAPLEILKGCAEAVQKFDVDILLTGKADTIKKVAAENNISPERMTIEDCDEVLTMHDTAESVLKAKKNSSMGVGFRMLNEGRGDAFLSAGNSGALCMGATLLVRRIKGIKRPAFAPVLPSSTGCFMLLDGGANVDCRPEMLRQFAVMASVYMEKVMKVDKPRIGLANVGTEDHKGTELYRETYALLRDSQLNFVGNIEGRDIPKGVCDAVVCDGFTGNMILKTYEGVASVLMKEIKNIFTGSMKGKMAAALVMKDLKVMKNRFDYNTYGGAPILGASKPVFKVHGNAKAITVVNAIGLCKDYVAAKAIDVISASLK